jgi:VWFA-related protein
MPGRMLVCAISAAFYASGGTPEFRAGITLVKAETTVCDKHTKTPIRGLAREDFLVFDGGQARPIEHFGTDSGPLDLLLLLDVSGSMREELPRVAVAAHTALQTLNAGDRAGVMAFGARYALTEPLTSDFDAVKSGILRMFIARVGEDTDISQAVRGAAQYMAASAGPAKRAILIMTDNMQETPIPDDEVERALFDADAVLDAVVIRGLLPMPHVVHPGVLRFAPNTGGEVIEGNHPGPLVAEMIERIRSRYSIHFRPVATESSRPRRIRVELSPAARRKYPNAVVRARGSYYAGAGATSRND